MKRQLLAIRESKPYNTMVLVLASRLGVLSLNKSAKNGWFRSSLGVTIAVITSVLITNQCG